MKRALLLFGGIVALLVSAGFAFFLFFYLKSGAGGLPFLWFTGTVIALVHVVGTILAAFVAFALGVYWCAEAMVARSVRTR